MNEARAGSTMADVKAAQSRRRAASAGYVPGKPRVATPPSTPGSARVAVGDRVHPQPTRRPGRKPVGWK